MSKETLTPDELAPLPELLPVRPLPTVVQRPWSTYLLPGCNILILLALLLAVAYLFFSVRELQARPGPEASSSPTPTSENVDESDQTALTTNPAATNTPEPVPPTPGITETPASSPEIFGNLPLAAGTELRLGRPADNTWVSAGEPIVLGPDGDFRWTLAEGGEIPWLGIPEGWALTLTGVQGEAVTAEGYTWWQVIGNESIELAPGSTIQTQRIFRGHLYFQGITAPDTAIVHLERCSLDNVCTLAGETTLSRPADFLTSPTALPFELSDLSHEVNVSYQISVPDLNDALRDWAAGVPGEIGTVQQATIRVTLDDKLRPYIADGLAFAGPLPILLDFHDAMAQPAYDMDAAKPPFFWKDENREPSAEGNPYMARPGGNEVAEEQWVRWPIWLPAGSAYRLIILLPSTNYSAHALYKLLPASDVEGASPIWESLPVSQCQVGGSREIPAEPPILVSPGSEALWLQIDDRWAAFNTDCIGSDAAPLSYRLAIWQLRIERAPAEEG